MRGTPPAGSRAGPASRTAAACRRSWQAAWRLERGACAAARRRASRRCVCPIRAASAALARYGTGAAAPRTIAARLQLPVGVEVEHDGDIGERPVEANPFRPASDAPCAVLAGSGGSRIAVRISCGFRSFSRWMSRSGGTKKSSSRTRRMAPVGVRELDRRAQRHQHGGGRGGMDDRARPVVEDRVVLVFARDREAVAAALPQAVIFRGAEIPAARPLQQIAAERRDVADLRARRAAQPHRPGRDSAAARAGCVGELAPASPSARCAAPPSVLGDARRAPESSLQVHDPSPAPADLPSSDRADRCRRPSRSTMSPRAGGIG